jgi:membrane protease YdiL (CAAX protease family)
MTQIEISARNLRQSTQIGALGELTMMVVLGASLLTLHAGTANGGDWVARLMVPGRILLACLFATVLLRRRGETWASVGLVRPVSLWRTAVLVLTGYLAISAVAVGLLSWVFPALGIAADPTGSVSSVRSDPGEYAYWLAVSWTSAALGEELLFRGFFRSRLERVFGERVPWAAVGAVLGQGVLFGLGHGNQGLGGILLTGTTGLMLGVVCLAGHRNLIACIALHALIDTISLTVVFLGAAPGPK